MKSTKKNLSYNVALTISNLLFPLISFPYVSRIIGPEGIGKVQFIVTFSQYFVLIAALGIPIYGVREISKVSKDRVKLNQLFSELFSIGILSSILMAIIYFILIFFVDRFSDDKALYSFGGLLILLSFTSIDWFYSGLEEFGYITLRSLIIKSIALICLFAFVTDREDITMYLIITVFAFIGNNIWNIIFLNKKININLRGLNLKRHLPALITLFSTSIATSIYTVMDTLILGFLTNDTFVGYYTAAIKINKIAIPLIVSLGVVLIPKISNSILNQDYALFGRLVDKSFSFVCLAGIPISILLCIYARDIMIVFSGKEFEMATITMQIASPLVFLIGLGHIFGLQVLIPSNGERYYLKATLIGMIGSLLLNFFLITAFEDKGAAAATVCGEILVTFVSYYYVVKKFNYRFKWSSFIKSAISCFVFLPIVYILRNYEVGVLKLVSSLLLSVSLYFLVQLVIFKESILVEVTLAATVFFKLKKSNES